MIVYRATCDRCGFEREYLCISNYVPDQLGNDFVEVLIMGEFYDLCHSCDEKCKLYEEEIDLQTKEAFKDFLAEET